MKTDDAVVILPVTTVNETTYKYAFTTIKSCYDTTKAGIFVMDNNSHGSSWTERLKKDCEAMGVRYEYFPQKFSTSKFFNIGRDRTHGKYIAYGSSDLVFHPNWLENIIELWEEQPEWFCLAPFQVGSRGMSCAKDDARLEHRIVATHNVACGIAVFKRSNGFRWNEAFPFQCDSNLVYEAEVNGWRMGYCLNSRIEHIAGSCIRSNTDQSLHNEAPEKDENQLLRELWGKRYLGT